MPRVPRGMHWSEEACFHLVNRGHHRDVIIADNEAGQSTVDLVAQYWDPYSFQQNKRS
jgi:hypothetical protein